MTNTTQTNPPRAWTTGPELFRRLTVYVRHLKPCKGGRDCDCGLDATLRELCEFLEDLECK